MAEFNNYLTTEEGWNDYTSSFVPSAVHPSTTPTYEDMGNGIYALHFSTGNVAFINFHIKHDILTGSMIYPHIHFSCADAFTVSFEGLYKTGTCEYT